MYQRSDGRSEVAVAAGAHHDMRPCSNCHRPAIREIDVDASGGPAVYSCSTCGQREAVSWRYIPARVVEAAEVIEEPYIILCEH